MELLLVLCLCISTWTGKTLGDENGVVTVNVSQGAILPCSPTTKEDLSFKSFKWRKDGQNVFHYNAGIHYNDGLDGQDPQFKGRVSFFEDRLSSGDASIQIQNVKFPDSGIYSCEISGLNSGIQTFNIKLVVNVPTLPATEGSDVMLPCSPSGKIDLTHQVFDWKKDDTQQVFLYDNGKHYNNGKPGQHDNFKNRVEFFQDQLQLGNASIRINKTKLNDSGMYSCTFPKLQPPEQQFYMKLVVRASAKPSVRTIKETDEGTQLSCEVLGASPKPIIVWHDSAGHNLSAEKTETTDSEGHYNILLKTTVTITGNYTCVATQEELHHQIKITTFVRVRDVCPKPILSIEKKTADGIRVICSVPGVSKVEMELHNSDDGTVYKPVEAVTSQNPQDFMFSVTKEDNYRCLVKQNEFCHQLYSEEIFVPISGDDKGLSPGYVIVIVAVILIAIVTAAVLYFRRKHIRFSGDRTLRVNAII